MRILDDATLEPFDECVSHMKVYGIGHEGVYLLIFFENKKPKVFNKDGNIETHEIGVDMDNILDKLVEAILIIHFPMYFQ